MSDDRSAADATRALGDSARDGEPERHLAALLAPEPARSALLAIAAFGAEIRRIPSAVSEPAMGEIRLQWWRDAIAAGVETGHPVADAVVHAIAGYRLPPALFTAQIEARAFDLYPDPMPDEAALAGYLAKTEGCLFELGFRVVAGAPGVRDLEASVAAGRAYGLVRLLADLPLRQARGRCPLPPPAGGGIEDATAAIMRLQPDISAARGTAMRHVVTLSRENRIAFLPLAVVGSYQRRLGRPITPLTRVGRIAAAHWLGLS